MKNINNYLIQLEQDILRDENQQSNGSSNQSEIPHMEDAAKFTLGDLLSMFGAADDSAYVSIVKKMHELLGQFGKKGLDEKGKADINLLVQDLNKFAPKIGPIVEKTIRQYGYNLDAEIPIEAALGGYVVFVGYRMNSTRREILSRMNSEKETIKTGGKEWQ